MTSPKIRITVMISGSGTNLQALIDAVKDHALPNASIVRVISNRKAACKMMAFRTSLHISH
jgi:phosphoribosylglycinamide formyltransferase